MVIVTMRQTMQAAILMVVTVVEITLTPNGVQNVFVMNKHRIITHVHIFLIFVFQFRIII